MPEKLVLGGKNCIFETKGNGRTVFLMAEDAERFEETVDGLLKRLAGVTDFSLLAYEIKDWNAELSVRKLSNGKMHFDGRGEETLAYVKESLIPYVLSRIQDAHIYTAGYSLAGLFAAWSFTKLGDIKGFMSASGSFWLEDFEKTAEFPHARAVYLSLGDKEEQTKNQMMKNIGMQTRRLASRLKDYSDECIYVSNPGGHFTDPEGRAAAGFKWIIEKDKG